MRKLIKQRTNPPPTEQKGEAGLSTAKLQEIKEEDHGTIQHKGFEAQLPFQSLDVKSTVVLCYKEFSRQTYSTSISWARTSPTSFARHHKSFAPTSAWAISGKTSSFVLNEYKKIIEHHTLFSLNIKNQTQALQNGATSRVSYLLFICTWTPIYFELSHMLSFWHWHSQFS